MSREKSLKYQQKPLKYQHMDQSDHGQYKRIAPEILSRQ